MRGLREFYLMAIVLGIGTVLLSLGGAQYLLDRALLRDASSQGMDWAHFIESRLDQIAETQNEDGTPDRTMPPNREGFKAILDDVFAVGHIFQIDYINPNCLCDISLNSNNPKVLRRGNLPVEHPVGDGILPPKETVPGQIADGRGTHALGSGDSPQSNSAAMNTEAKYPIDPELLREVAEEQKHEIYIRSSRAGDVPSTLAEVFHPVASNGETAYVIRVIVDMEEEAIGHKRLMLTTAILSGLMLLLAVGFPARRYIHTLRQERNASKRVAFLANHDVLTNLHNRNNFQESISDILWGCHEKQQSALIFMFDLNGLKEVNDYNGHHIGDQLLCAFASLLEEHTPEGGYIARLGGDEFVVVIAGLPMGSIDYSDHFDLPKTVSVMIDDGGKTVSASIAGGVVCYPEDAQRTEDLMQMVDLALYAAKPNRSGTICRYQVYMKEEFLDRRTLHDEFRAALEASQLTPFYQPVVDLRTGTVVAFEALARWDHPEKGVLTPYVFEAIFEDAELSARLGTQMFEKIANDMEAWTAQGIPFHKVALNVINGDLNREDFSASILSGLKKRGLCPSNLAIEINENCLFSRNKQQFLAHLQTLRDAGCLIALDDFGTGYSSITQLKELPVTSVKIDKSFVENILENETDKSIIAALLQMSNSMHFHLILEGIETIEQLTFLREMGFVLGQGFYYSKAVPAAEVPALIARQNAANDIQDLA